MKLIKQLESHRNHAVAKTVVYKDVSFPHGFSHFLEALVLNKLAFRTERSWRPDGVRWVDDVGVGGILFETAVHPMFNKVHNNYAGDITVAGSSDALALVESMFKTHGVVYEGASQPEDVELKHQYHDVLNPEMWTENKEILPDVKEKLMKIADAFIKFLKIEGFDDDVEDIIVTGSSANFNWTELSDVDLHIVVDFEKMRTKHGDLVDEYFNAKKNVFNNLHEISIRGNNVEMYVQDAAEPHHSTGVYSLLKEEWVEEPEHKEPQVDDGAVRAKAAEMMNAIDDVVGQCDKAAPVEALMEKLKKMRGAGLEEAGEFSVENLVFKQLRHNGYLEKLSTCKTKAFDRELSIEEEEWSALR
jgi:predicted nucleotidyltransferase